MLSIIIIIIIFTPHVDILRHTFLERLCSALCTFQIQLSPHQKGTTASSLAFLLEKKWRVKIILPEAPKIMIIDIRCLPTVNIGGPIALNRRDASFFSLHRATQTRHTKKLLIADLYTL